MDGLEAALVGDHGPRVKRGTVFYKMTGSGNDFVALDGRYVRPEDLSAPLVRALCDRRFGAGADGVMLLDPAAPDGAHFTFHFWNSDGSEGPMCGNGALCATRLATLIELAPGEDEVVFATRAGLHRGRIVSGLPEIALPDCAFPKAVPGVRLEDGEREAHLGTPSVPHLVVLVDDVDRVDVGRRGPPLRRDPALGPGGANVNWVSAVGDGTYRMRTFERGVEGETLACGTGAVACALVLEGQGVARSPARIWTRSGLPLDISWRRKSESEVTDMRLRGEGRVVYKGVLSELVIPTE